MAVHDPATCPSRIKAIKVTGVSQWKRWPHRRAKPFFRDPSRRERTLEHSLLVFLISLLPRASPLIDSKLHRSSLHLKLVRDSNLCAMAETLLLDSLLHLPEVLEKIVFPPRARENHRGHSEAGTESRIAASDGGFGSTPVDILETPKAYSFFFDVPGIPKSDIQVLNWIELNLLVLWLYCEFRHSFYLEKKNLLFLWGMV